MGGAEPGDLAGRAPERAPRDDEDMCRSIKVLRPPFLDEITDEDVHAAALQYIRKVSGFRQPAAHNAEAFESAVEAVAKATAELLASLTVRGSGRS